MAGVGCGEVVMGMGVVVRCARWGDEGENGGGGVMR